MFSVKIDVSKIKLGLATSALLFAGCSDDGAPEQVPLGKVEMNLVGQAPSGNSYRLRDGIVWVDGPDTSVFFDTESDPDQSSLSATVPPGYYTSNLWPGWYLEHLEPDGTSEAVEATMLSPNPDSFNVFSDQNTQVAFRFRVNGEEIVLDDGSFEIVLDVEEEGSGPLSNCPYTEFGAQRECGWSLAPGFQGAVCSAGEEVSVGCGCDGGTCGGDPMIRVCEGDEACSADVALAVGDQECGSCPQANFICPPSGAYTVLIASWMSSEGYTCQPEASP